MCFLVTAMMVLCSIYYNLTDECVFKMTWMLLLLLVARHFLTISKFLFSILISNWFWNWAFFFSLNFFLFFFFGKQQQTLITKTAAFLFSPDRLCVLPDAVKLEMNVQAQFSFPHFKDNLMHHAWNQENIESLRSQSSLINIHRIFSFFFHPIFFLSKNKKKQKHTQKKVNLFFYYY